MDGSAIGRAVQAAGARVDSRWASGSASSRPSPGRSRTPSTSTSTGSPGSYDARPPRDRARSVESRPRARRRAARSCERRRRGADRLGPAVPISRRSRRWACRSARASTSTSRSATGATTSSTGSSRGCRACRTSRSATRRRSTVATFFSPERLSYPPGKAQRERLLNRTRRAARDDARSTAAAAGERFPGDYRVVSEGVDVERFSPAPKRNVIAIEWRPSDAPRRTRRASRSCEICPDWEVVFVRTRSMFGRPFVPRAAASTA